MSQFFIAKNRYLISILFSIMFLFTLVYNIPSWVLSNVVQNYSQGRLKLYDTQGTFWKGSGLLVAIGSKLDTSAPLLLINWQIKLGIPKFVDIQFTVDKKQVADLYINKHGANLDKLNLSLSITQVEQLFDIAKSMSLSGNINLSADHIQVGKKIVGNILVSLDNLSSGISKVNPLGSYVVQLTTDTGDINVHSSPNSVLNLSGNGTVNSLSLNVQINPANKEDMLQFVTLMGAPKPDGSYQLKIF